MYQFVSFQSNFLGTHADSNIQYVLRIFERYVC